MRAANRMDMNLYWVSPLAIEHRSMEELNTLLHREDGFLWLDIPKCDDAAARTLLEFFRFQEIDVFPGYFVMLLLRTLLTASNV